MTSDTDAAGLVDRGEWLRTRPREHCFVAASETGGACSDVEILSHASGSRPTHVHQNDDEHFLTLDGAARIARCGESFDCSQLGFSVAEGYPEAADHMRQGVGSSLVRRLVLAKDDPAKQRIRAWLSDIDDERLFSLGLTSEDVVALRNTSPRVEAAINAPSAPPNFPTDCRMRPTVCGVVSS